MSEKRTPAYHLGSFISWASGEAFQVTKTALGTAAALGLTRSDMVEIIKTMTPPQFYKSMTSIADHTVWQDVYHVPSSEGLLYVKFQADVVTEFVLLSFKEK